MYDSKEDLPVSTTSIQTAVSFVYSTTNEITIHSKSPRYSHPLSNNTSSEEMKTAGVVPEDHISTPVISNRPSRDNPPLLYLPFSGAVSSPSQPKYASLREEGTDSRQVSGARFSNTQDDPIFMSNSILEEWKRTNGSTIAHPDPHQRLYFTISERLPTLVDLVSSPRRNNEYTSSIVADLARYGLESFIRLALTLTKNQIKRSLYQGQTIPSTLTNSTSYPLSHARDAGFAIDGPWSRIARQAFGITEMNGKSTPPSKSFPSTTTKPSIRSATSTVVGIPNYGQTCFLNAVIQALAALESFVTYLERMVRLNMEQRNFLTSTSSEPEFTLLTVSADASKPLLCQDLLNSLKSVNGHPLHGRVDPRSILLLVGQKNAQFRRRFGLVTGEQQDAQELLQALLGMIIDEGQFELTPFAVPSTIVTSFTPTTDEDDGDEVAANDGDSFKPIDTMFLNRDVLDDVQWSKAMEIMMTTSSAISPSPLSVWCGSALICATCRRARPIQNAPFLDIPIVPTSISQHASAQQSNCTGGSRYIASSCRLEDCLEEFTSIERVHDVECRNCTIQSEIQYYESEKSFQLQIIQGLESRRKASSGRANHADDECKVVRDELQAIEGRIHKLQHLSPDEDTPGLHRELDDDLDPAAAPKPVVLKRSDAFKCLLLTRLPSILTIHVQRRYYDPASGKTSKTMQHVAFPEMLNVAPYCAYGGSQRSKFPFTGMPRPQEERSAAPIWYKIMAVIEHRGGPYSGHYVCYRRDPSGQGNRWFWISDDKVRSCLWSDVRRCQAYMLFYEAT
jgi:ubiquitin C-terminal hydrolase